jgi:hypothetical protein
MSDDSVDFSRERKLLNGMQTRRHFITATGAAGLSALTAGCLSEGKEGPSTTTKTPTTTETTTTQSTTTQENTTQTTTQDSVTVEDLHRRRENLSEERKTAYYQTHAIPGVSDYELDYGRVEEENDTRREQLIDITATVGDQYENWVTGNHAVMNAIHNLDWMGWKQDNILNIVTRYNSRPGEEITINYNTRDNGGRNLDGTIARDGGSGPQTYIKNIPDSEVMDGDEGNALVTDIKGHKTLKQNAEENGNSFDEGDWRGLQLSMQSIVPGLKGPSVHADRVPDRNLIFDADAFEYIGEHYKDSAEAVNDVSDEALEIGMSSVPVRSSGMYVGVTAGKDGLEAAAIYSQAKGKEKMKQPVEL